MKYFDAHCHVQFSAYDADRDAVIARMKDAEVGGLVVGTDAATSRLAAELVQEHDHLWASVGLHPNHASDEEFDEHLFRNLLMYPKVVAIGECGLDYYRPQDVTDEVVAKQKELFTRHVRLAGQTKRPLIVHARPRRGTVDAYTDALDIIEEAKKEFGDALTGDFHFFVGDAATAARAAMLGFTVSYTAVLTITHDYDSVVKSVPLTSLLTETDAPYVAPASKRGQRNEPTAVIEVVAAMAAAREEDPEMVRDGVLANARRLFALA
jgi:TatD DNase family protein